MTRKAFASLVVGALALATMAGEVAAVTLASEGRTDYVIAIPAEATPTEQRGAEEIRLFIERMSGAALPIVAGAQPLPEKAIVIRRADAAGSQTGEEAFAIRTEGSRVVITSTGGRGAMYGCGALLEKLGVRWFTPKVTRIPALKTIDIPEIDETQRPAFEYREPFFTEAFDRDWAARLKINGSHAQLDDSVGGHIVYGRWCHTFDELVPRELFKEHPEYFPLIKGNRADGYVQRCLTNPDVLKMSIQRVRDWMRSSQATIFSVSQNDCAGWCECDQCRRITDQYGGQHSGLYLWFVNQVAEAVEKEHPDKLIDTLAYQFTEQPPAGIVPRNNVRIRLCPISACEAHPYEQCTAPANIAFVQNLANWAKITDTLYIWHYNTNFANYLLPFPDFEEFPAEVRLYQRHGVKGIFFQGAYAPGGGGSDAELRPYVMAKLLWDPTLDSDALVSEWMEGVYGPAMKPMRAWFDLLHEKARDPNKHFFIFDAPAVHYLGDDVLAAGDRLFDEAEKLAAGNAIAAEYIAKARLSLRYSKLAIHPAGGEEFDRFIADVRKAGITQMREGQPVDAWERAYREKLKQ